MMVELVLRVPCKHGKTKAHNISDAESGRLVEWEPPYRCPGGRVTVLDPDKVVFKVWDSHNQQYSITVQDVIDALTKEEK